MLNTSFTQSFQITDHQTAIFLGSGSLPVYATPSLVALMENTSMKMLTDLPEGKTSVGIAIDVQHLKASPVGAVIECTATITAIEGRKYTFNLKATDSNGVTIGEGTHQRVVVDIERFMSKCH